MIEYFELEFNNSFVQSSDLISILSSISILFNSRFCLMIAAVDGFKSFIQKLETFSFCCSSLINLMALSLFALELKSQGWPSSGSRNDKSNENPGNKPHLVANGATRGGE